MIGARQLRDTVSAIQESGFRQPKESGFQQPDSSCPSDTLSEHHQKSIEKRWRCALPASNASLLHGADRFGSALGSAFGPRKLLALQGLLNFGGSFKGSSVVGGHLLRSLVFRFEGPLAPILLLPPRRHVCFHCLLIVCERECQDLGSRVEGLGLSVYGVGFGVQGLGFCLKQLR